MEGMELRWGWKRVWRQVRGRKEGRKVAAGRWGFCRVKLILGQWVVDLGRRKGMTLAVLAGCTGDSREGAIKGMS